MTDTLAVRIELYIREYTGCTDSDIISKFRSVQDPDLVMGTVSDLIADGIVTSERHVVNTDPEGNALTGNRYYHRMAYRGPRDEREPVVEESEDVPEEPRTVFEKSDERTVGALAPAILILARRVYPTWLSMYDVAKEIADPKVEDYTKTMILARDILEHLHANGDLEQKEVKGTLVYRVVSGKTEGRTVRIEKSKANHIWDTWLKLNNGKKCDFQRTSLGSTITLMLTPGKLNGFTIRRRNGDADEVTSLNWMISETRKEYIVLHTVKDYIAIEVSDVPSKEVES